MPCESVPSTPARGAYCFFHAGVLCCCHSACNARCAFSGFRVIWRGLVFALVQCERAPQYRQSLYANLTLMTGFCHLSQRVLHDELVLPCGQVTYLVSQSV